FHTTATRLLRRDRKRGSQSISARPNRSHSRQPHPPRRSPRRRRRPKSKEPGKSRQSSRPHRPPEQINRPSQKRTRNNQTRSRTESKGRRTIRLKSSKSGRRRRMG